MKKGIVYPNKRIVIIFLGLMIINAWVNIIKYLYSYVQ